MVKVLSSRMQQCLSPFTMLLVEGSSERIFLDIYLTTYLGVRNIKYTSSVRVIFFWKYSKFNVDFRNWEKNPEQVFCFWDNSIWIGCVKLCLLGREYLSTAVNVLTNKLKVLQRTKRDFSNSIAFTVINKYGKGAVLQNPTGFRLVYNLACRRAIWNGTF